MHRRTSFPLLAILFAVPPAACQDTKPAAEAGAAAELVRIATEVEKDVEALRGWTFKHEVKKGVLGEAELRRYLEKKLFEEEYGGGKLERTQAFLRLVGLIPKDCDLEKTMVDVLLNQVGGFYDPEAKTFYMLQRSGTDYGPLFNRVLIAHELTHALDDQHVDLDRMMRARERTEDWGLAVGAVAEGSATSLMTVYMTRLVRSGEYDVAALQEVMKAEAERSKAFFAAPPYFATLAATYMCGLHFLLRGESALTVMAGAKDQVGEDFLAAAKDPPRSTEQVLHPDKYWKHAERDEPVVIDDAWVERLLAREVPGWRVVHKDTVGELLCAVLTNPRGRKLDPQLMANASYWTNTAAKGWGGDRFFLLAQAEAGKDSEAGKESENSGGSENGGGESVAPRGVWITAWDTVKDADEFVTAYEERNPDPARTTVRIGARMIAFLFGLGAGAEPLAETLRETPPPASRAWNPWTDAAK